MRSADLVALANVNPEHSFTVLCSFDDKIVSQTACFQAALLYTTPYGERRIRVLNMAVGVTDDLKEVFSSIDPGALITLLAKQSVEKVIANKIEDGREYLANKCVETYGACATAFGTKSQVPINAPESLHGLAQLVLAVAKSPAFRGSNTTPADYRSFILALMRSLSIVDLIHLVHPYFCALHQLSESHGVVSSTTGHVELPPALPLTSESIHISGIYLLHNGLDAFIWIGSNAQPELVEALLGKPPHHIESGKFSVPSSLSNPWSERLVAILGRLHELHPTHSACLYVIREDSADQSLKALFSANLCLDRCPDQQPPYNQWLSFLQSKVSTGSF